MKISEYYMKIVMMKIVYEHSCFKFVKRRYTSILCEF